MKGANTAYRIPPASRMPYCWWVLLKANIANASPAFKTISWSEKRKFGCKCYEKLRALISRLPGFLSLRNAQTIETAVSHLPYSMKVILKMSSLKSERTKIDVRMYQILRQWRQNVLKLTSGCTEADVNDVRMYWGWRHLYQDALKSTSIAHECTKVECINLHSAKVPPSEMQSRRSSSNE